MHASDSRIPSLIPQWGQVLFAKCGNIQLYNNTLLRNIILFSNPGSPGVGRFVMKRLELCVLPL